MKARNIVPILLFAFTAAARSASGMEPPEAGPAPASDPAGQPPQGIVGATLPILRGAVYDPDAPDRPVTVQVDVTTDAGEQLTFTTVAGRPGPYSDKLMGGAHDFRFELYRELASRRDQ